MKRLIAGESEFFMRLKIRITSARNENAPKTFRKSHISTHKYTNDKIQTRNRRRQVPKTDGALGIDRGLVALTVRQKQEHFEFFA